MQSSFGCRSDLGNVTHVQSHCSVNVSQTERTISAAAGGAALVFGLSRGSLSGLITALVGGGLIYRGLTGHCSVYEALDYSTAGSREDEDEPPRAHMHSNPSRGMGEASLAATGESP
ncbi:MAG TPA: DUF2892 domain-containing protein [Planctomycetaceae bacterium]|nr:DUF2892 domain-containing protein [Planctomycetaceae bacterium]